MHLRRDFQAQRVEADEAGGVVLVVGLGRVGFHRGEVRVVEAHGGFAACDHDVALVKFHAHRAGHVLLALGHVSLECEAFGRKPEAVVNELGILGNERVALVHDFAVHRERFHLAMREMQNRAAGRLIHAARFHADETVLDHVHAPDAMFAAELVQRAHHAERI